MNKFQYPIYQEPIEEFRSGSFQDNMYQEFNNVESYNSLKYTKYQPIDFKPETGKCLLGRDNCSPLCSGYTQNKCNIVAPIPGPQWQVQSAATVQERLKNQDYTPSRCQL